MIFAFAAFLFIVCSCKTKEEKQALKVQKEFSFAQEFYDKKGFANYKKYVEKNGYFAVLDNENNGATPFLVAIKNKNLEDAKFFIEKGASFEEKDKSGFGCVHYSLETKDKETVEYVVSIMPESFWSTIHADGVLPCVEYIKNCQNFSILKKVLDLTGNVNWHDNKGKTLLMYASQNNADVRTVKYLLDKGAEIDAKNLNEWTSLMYAARYNPNPAVAEDLILRGADSSPNSVGLTISMLASCNQNPGVLMTVLKYQDDANAITLQGKTALMYACENQADSSILKLLIDSKADVNLSDNNGKTALMYALQNCKKPDSVYVLLSAGADENVSDKSGKSVRQYLLENQTLASSDVKNAFGFKKTELNQSENQKQAEPLSDDENENSEISQSEEGIKNQENSHPKDENESNSSEPEKQEN